MKKILIVDDDLDLLDGLNSLLSNKGYQIKTLSDGATALPVSQAFHPDAIILDVNLPGINGKEVCRRLKQDYQTKCIPIIMISADADQKDIWATCQADEFLEKPFSLRILFSKLESITA